MKIAIVGTGVSGMVTAYLLSDSHDLTVFEKNDYIGGHTQTHDVEAQGRTFAVDTGFIVFNQVTYPNFVKLLRRLDVPWKNSQMSFSLRCEQTGMEYCPSSLDSLFAQRRNLLRPSFYRMVLEIFRFRREALELLEQRDDTVNLAVHSDEALALLSDPSEAEMTESILPADRRLAQSPVLTKLDGWAKRILLSLLQKIRLGEILLKDGDEQHVFGQRSQECDLRASLNVLHPRFYTQVLFGGSIGAGEAYMAGHWSSDDLTVLLRIILLNQSVFAGLDRGLSRLKAPLYKAYHFLHKDSRKGSRINIAAHYDLGNDFYALFRQIDE